MKVTWSWLQEWTDLPESPEELAQLLAMRGLPVQSLERGLAYDPGIVVGRVVECEPHPNADRLRLCVVDVGTGTLSIVCGAANVAAGQRVAVAQVGSRLPDGTRLRKTKIRGVDSDGMICSERELGRSEESEGIWVLPGEPAVGVPLASVLPSSDTVLDVEVTSNRTDCMAVIGLAREIASARGAALKPMPPLPADGPDPLPKVVLEDSHDCPRYMARRIQGLRVGPSPEWLRRRLEATGSRSINNLVDVTNYVLRDFGQPIHAFDATKVGGNAIRVRRARPGEKLTLLDGRDVALRASHLVIADASIPMALAGVMGGLASGVTESTTAVILESAQFDPLLTQETARSLGIQSDAAARFAQGVDPEGVAHALDAAARLMAQVAGGTVARERVDQWPGRAEAPAIRLSRRRLTRLLGFDVDADSTTRALRSLGITPAAGWKRRGDDEVAAFRVPSFRKDLGIEEDLVEEVGRAIGYDRIPARLRVGPMAEPQRGSSVTPLSRIVTIACGLGFHEALNTALVGEIPREAREGVADPEIWEIQNPKSRELKHLRLGLLPGLVQAAARNLHHGSREVRLVEVGKVFRATPPPIGSERFEAALLLAGAPDEWGRPGSEADRYLDVKGAAEALLEALGIDSCRTDPYHEACWKRGTGASITRSGEPLGHLGEVAPSLATALGLERPAWAAVLDVAAIGKAVPRVRAYEAIPRYPVSKRDLAIVVSRDTRHASVEELIRAEGGKLLTQVRLFDVFEGGSIGSGKKSMAYALEFQAPDRTLSDPEVDVVLQAIVRALSAKLGAAQRGGSPVGLTS